MHQTLVCLQDYKPPEPEPVKEEPVQTAKKRKKKADLQVCTASRCFAFPMCRGSSFDQPRVCKPLAVAGKEQCTGGSSNRRSSEGSWAQKSLRRRKVPWNWKDSHQIRNATFVFFLVQAWLKICFAIAHLTQGRRRKRRPKMLKLKLLMQNRLMQMIPEEDEDEDEAETEPKEMQRGGSRVRSRALVERSDCLQVLFDTSEIKRDFCSLNLCKPLVRSGPNGKVFLSKRVKKFLQINWKTGVVVMVVIWPRPRPEW